MNLSPADFLLENRGTSEAESSIFPFLAVEKRGLNSLMFFWEFPELAWFPRTGILTRLDDSLKSEQAVETVALFSIPDFLSGVPMNSFTNSGCEIIANCRFLYFCLRGEKYSLKPLVLLIYQRIF